MTPVILKTSCVNLLSSNIRGNVGFLTIVIDYFFSVINRLLVYVKVFLYFLLTILIYFCNNQFYIYYIAVVTNICIKQIMHSFCVYIQSLTTASGSRLFGKSIGLFHQEVLGSNPVVVESFSAMPYFSSLRLSCRNWVLVRDRTLFRQKLALHHHKWWLPRNGGVLRISA